MAVTLERRLARRRIARRMDDILPLEFSKQTPMLEVRPGPIGRPGGPGLWRVKGMGFPPYFQNVRNALIRNGHSVATASAITWGAIRRWARGGGNVHPEVREAAKRALASIAGKEARARAQSAAHEHTTLRDQFTLREFARYGLTIDLADPYHAGAGSRQGGQFTSAGNAGAGGGKAQPASGNKSPVPPPTISPQQKQKYLKLAAADIALAAKLRAEAAKINQQIAALAALIAVQQKYLATASTGATNQGAGTQTGTGTGTGTQAGQGTQTQNPLAGQVTVNVPGKNSAGATGFNVATTKQALAQNQQTMKQLVSQRNALLQRATQLDQQAQNYQRLANG